MNLAEFAALKLGDQVIGMAGSSGTVTEVRAEGVRVSWGPGPVTFLYTRDTTSWMHWRLPEPRDCTAGPCYNARCHDSDQCLGGDYDKIAAGCTHSCMCGRGDEPCPGPDGKPLCARDGVS